VSTSSQQQEGDEMAMVMTCLVPFPMPLSSQSNKMIGSKAGVTMVVTSLSKQEKD
jgi:hypothetical protein